MACRGSPSCAHPAELEARSAVDREWVPDSPNLPGNLRARGIASRGRCAFQIQPSMVASFICAAKQSSISTERFLSCPIISMAGNLKGWKLQLQARRGQPFACRWAKMDTGLMSSVASLPLPASLRHFPDFDFRFPDHATIAACPRWDDDGGPAKPGIFSSPFFCPLCWLTRQRQQERMNDSIAESRSRSPTLCPTGSAPTQFFFWKSLAQEMERNEMAGLEGQDTSWLPRSLVKRRSLSQRAGSD